MPKKQGNLKKALASFNKRQEQQQHQKAVQEALQRKADPVTRPAKKPRQSKPSSSALATASTSSSSPSTSTANEACDQARPHQPRKRIIEPFDHDDTILIVGEANFSFTLSLLSPPRSFAPSQILSTAYDTEAECYQKYPDAEENVKKVRAIARREDVVVFGVDAGQLDKVKSVTGKTKGSRSSVPPQSLCSTRRWSKVWFGFPHVGAGHKDETRNVLANQLLLLRFLISVAPYLTDGPIPDHAAAALGQPRKRPHRDDSEDPDVAETEQDLTDPEAFEAGTEAEKEAFAASRAAHSFRPPSKRGSVLITLRNAAPYTLWNVPTLGKRLPEMLSSITPIAPPLPKGCRKPSLADLDASGLSRNSRPAQPNMLKGKPGVKSQRDREAQPRRNDGRRYLLWRSFEFEPSAWKGYEHRRTVGWVEGVSAGDNEDLLRHRNISTDPNARASRAGGGECRTWEFGLD